MAAVDVVQVLGLEFVAAARADARLEVRVALRQGCTPAFVTLEQPARFTELRLWNLDTIAMAAASESMHTSRTPSVDDCLCAAECCCVCGKQENREREKVG